MRDKASNFTLTDHFKLYKSKNKNTNKTVSAYSEEDVPTGRS